MTNAHPPSPDEQAAEGNKATLEEKHPIPEAITKFIHRARDIKWSGETFVPIATAEMKKREGEISEHIIKHHSLSKDTDPVALVHKKLEISEAVRKIKMLQYAEIPTLIETSLFLSLFSAFDAYTGELLTAIYKRKPVLFKKINRKIDLTDILTAHSIDDLKRSVLEDEIENFRRKSYVDQFIELENTFDVPLRKLNRWPEFVECTQRRNLLTHCDGIVSEQYLNLCKKEGCNENELPQLGARLGSEKFLPTCELMIEVGLKLGQTLWRKIFPEELKQAESHLHTVQFDALCQQNWEQAKIFGEFAVTQRNHSSEINRRMSIINYCSALKFSGDEDNAQRELGKIDWSASLSDFRLAEAIHKDELEKAASIMIRIGKSGEMVDEAAYHTWPLFHVFRKSTEFMTAYEKVYGYAFISKLEPVTDEALKEHSP